MATVRDDWYHLVPDEVVLKGLGQRKTLRCMCCKQEYKQGQFRCCAPPNGMASHHWLALDCPDPPHGCGKCAHHCECPTKAARLAEGPLARLGREYLAGRS